MFTTQGPSHSVKNPHAQWAHMCILFVVLREATKGQAKAPLRVLSEEGPWSTRHGGYRENETLRWPRDYSKGIMGHCKNRGASSHLPPSLKIHFKVPSGSLKPWTQLLSPNVIMHVLRQVQALCTLGHSLALPPECWGHRCMPSP